MPAILVSLLPAEEERRERKIHATASVRPSWLRHKGQQHENKCDIVCLLRAILDVCIIAKKHSLMIKSL